MEAVRRVQTLHEIWREYGVRPVAVSQRKKELATRSGLGCRESRADAASYVYRKLLFGEIGPLRMELDSMKRNLDCERGDLHESWIDGRGELAVMRRCALAAP